MKEYDFGLNWRTTEQEFFIDVLKDNLDNIGFSFLQISDDNIRNLLREIEKNETKIRFLLDTEATYNEHDDYYAKICYAIKDNEGIVINDPDKTRSAIDKSIMHYKLQEAGILVPYSVIVRNWEPKSFSLTGEEKEKLGTPFIIKPALGYSRKGVVEEAQGSVREIAAARKFDPGDNFLLQEKILPLSFGNKKAWFRVFHLFNKIIPCWWEPKTRFYQRIASQEFINFKLQPLAKMTRKIAEISQMEWFSTEIAIDQKNGKKRFLVIDYVNDQCDMTAQSKDKTGPPDAIVKYTAEFMVKAAKNLLSGKKLLRHYKILLKDRAIKEGF